jgi:2-methylisocitrate lyase-like PEP mutase family enzyme
LAVPLFINARTDFFLQARPEAHDAGFVLAAKQRAAAYAQAGASGFFVPGIFKLEHVRDVCAAATLPVNVMIVASLPSHAELAQLGVARISYGPCPYREAMKFIKQAARKAMQGE